MSLASEAYEIRTVLTAEAALRELNAQPPFFFLVDLHVDYAFILFRRRPSPSDLRHEATPRGRQTAICRICSIACFARSFGGGTAMTS